MQILHVMIHMACIYFILVNFYGLWDLAEIFSMSVSAVNQIIGGFSALLKYLPALVRWRIGPVRMSDT